MPRGRRYSWLVLVTAGPILLLCLRLIPALDLPVLHSPLGHVFISGSASLLGSILALLVLRTARRMRDGRVFLIGMGILGITSIFFIHAIATPNVLMIGRTIATEWSAVASLLLGGMFFALSGFDLSPAANQRLMRQSSKILALFFVCWLFYSWLVLIWIPSMMPVQVSGINHTMVSAAIVEHQYHEGADVEAVEDYGTPAGTNAATVRSMTLATSPNPIRIGLFGFGLLCYTFAVKRHYRLYRRAPSFGGRAIVCGITLLGEALFTQFLAPVYTISFWLYHAEEFIGFGVIGYAVLGFYYRGQTSENLLENLLLASTRARIQADYARVMDELVETLAHGEQPSPALQQTLNLQFGMTTNQVQVLERAAMAIAHERKQRKELEQLNATLQQLEQDKSEFMQMLVHDLKNPLTALNGFLQILCKDDLTPDQRLLVESALNSTTNLFHLISDLLDLGRMEAGKMELEWSLLVPRDLLANCVIEIRAWLAQSHKTIEIDAPHDLPLACADVRLIRRVMQNLISNAIKHTPTGTHIILRAWVSDQEPLHHPSIEGLVMPDVLSLILEVEDNGPGIAPQFLDQIFEKYVRVQGEQQEQREGTGLGLTFCRLAVAAHGGTISVVSALDKGTIFRVTLPMISLRTCVDSLTETSPEHTPSLLSAD